MNRTMPWFVGFVGLDRFQGGETMVCTMAGIVGFVGSSLLREDHQTMPVP